jgi:DUF218 domain
LEDRSRDTDENARQSKAIAQPRPGERWLLVTSAYHMPRAVGAFRRAGFAVEAYPVDWRTRGQQDFIQPFSSVSDGLKRLDTAAHEWVGLLVYWLTDRSSALFPGPMSGGQRARRTPNRKRGCHAAENNEGISFALVDAAERVTSASSTATDAFQGRFTVRGACWSSGSIRKVPTTTLFSPRRSGSYFSVTAGGGRPPKGLKHKLAEGPRDACAALYRRLGRTDRNG